MKSPIIIAVTGTFASGKDTAAQYLEKEGFCHFSLSDEVREIIRERGKEPSRDEMFQIAQGACARYGNAYFAERVLEKIKKADCKKYVVTSIRRPEEAQALKQNGARIWAVDAPLAIRFERARSRGRIGDGVTFEAFRAQEERELASKDPGGQQIGNVLRLADEKLENGGSREDFERAIELLLGKA